MSLSLQSLSFCCPSLKNVRINGELFTDKKASCFTHLHALLAFGDVNKFLAYWPRGYKTKSHAQLSSAQLSMKILLHIKVNKMPTITGILTFMSRKNSITGLSKPEKSRISQYFIPRFI